MQPSSAIKSTEEAKNTIYHGQVSEIPGTNELVDLGQLKSDFKHLGKEIVLVPQPSKDPQDPLNWTKYRKVFFMIQVIFATFMISCLTSVFGVAVTGYSAVGIDTAIVSRGTAVSFLLFGWTNLFIQPVSLSYGHRFFVLMMTLGCGVGAVMWSPYVSSTGTYYGARILQGILGAPFESLIELLVAEVFFEHERAFWMSSYGFALAGGSFFGTVAAAWIAQNMSWQWMFYFIAIFCGAAGVVMIFFLDESAYVRHFPVVEGSPVNPHPSSGYVQKSSESRVADVEMILNSNEVEAPPTMPLTSRSLYSRIQLFKNLKAFPSLWQFLRPIVLLYKMPHIQWAGWMVASGLIGFNVVTATVSTVFSSEPYNFSEGSLGLCYIGPAIGTIIGCIFSGPLNDCFCLRIAKARGGVHEAEDRIYGALPLIVLYPAGYILYGVGAAHKIHWSGPVIGLGILAFCMVAATSIPYTYAVDSAGGIESDCIVAIVILKSTVVFAVSFAITTWVENLGLQNAFISVAFILGFLFWITAIPMILWAKRIRIRTAPTYYKWAAEWI